MENYGGPGVPHLTALSSLDEGIWLRTRTEVGSIPTERTVTGAAFGVLHSVVTRGSVGSIPIRHTMWVIPTESQIVLFGTVLDSASYDQGR